MAEAAPALSDLPRVAEESIAAGELDTRLKDAREPFVVRGLASDWPLVKAGMEGAGTARTYLAQRARDRKFPVNIGEPGAGERLFYTDDMGMNFRMATGPLPAILDGIAANEGKADAPVIYLSSLDMRDYFNGLADENAVPLGGRRPIESIWIGGPTRIAAHNDVPDNLAVCAVGRRRFTVFPPEQMANLYPGPLENTPAGRPVSMVDMHDPDFGRYPRFAEALESARIAELEPGDALFVPSLWWHHVEGLTPFNVLVNYWWRDAPAFLGKPEDALFHAILAVRDLPDADKERWREIFDHYVFGDTEGVAAHLPESARGILGQLTPESAGQIRAKLLRGLSG